MPQNEFIFKHFIVKQDKTAMKVGTDAMILGAWTARRIESESAENNESAKSDRAKSENAENINYRILDIGTGTGVLSLMLAQCFSPLSEGGEAIDAVEIDGNAYLQAKENFENSSWKNRLNVFHSSIQDFKPSESAKYDLIISNPPYFEHNVKADNESSKYRERSEARSLNTLSFEDLLVHAKRLLKENGRFYMILPYQSSFSFISTAQIDGMHLFDRLDIKSYENQEPVRSILGFSKSRYTFYHAQLVIYDDHKNYSREYIKLTGDYHSKDLSKNKLSENR